MTTEISSATAVPPGARNGRDSPGCRIRSATNAGKISRYARTISAIATVSAAEKYFCPSPDVSARPATTASSETPPDTSPITTGTPLRAEIRPSAGGPAPSRQAAAWARPAPMIQAEPLASSTHTNRSAPAAPTTAPAPVSVAPPSAATDPPKTVNTVAIASISPWSDVTASAGSTNSTARIGTAYMSVWQTPARAMATGMSRRGSTISSAAVDSSSTPMNEYRRTGAIAMNVP